MINMEDVTDRIVRDMNSGLDKNARDAKPATKLTATQLRVLRAANGTELPFISNVLVYSRVLRSLPKAEQKALYALVKGGWVRVMYVFGAPNNSDAKRDAPFATSHYLLVVP